MASFRSLGQHAPSALHYLVSEAILPDDPDPSLYNWETYHTKEHGGEAYDELLVTEYCVVWSRNSTIRKVFNFRVEQQKILQAVLTYFVQEETPVPNQTGSLKEYDSPQASGERTRLNLSPVGIAQSSEPDLSATPQRSRALAVFLKSQAYVFFLQGSSHNVNLPFEVEKVFPAPTGLILQRRLPPEASPSTPALPSAPQNSFFSPLAFSSQSLRVPQSVMGKRQVSWRSSDASGIFTLSDLLRGSSLNGVLEDELPRLYSLTDPLSEMGLVVYKASVGPQSSYSSSTHTAVHATSLQALPKEEELLYVSPFNESPLSDRSGDRPLLFAVTANFRTRSFNLWQFSHVLPLAASTSNAPAKTTPFSAGNKPRRRSSFIPGTGATTPISRSREGGRESFGGTGKAAPSRNRTVAASLNASQQSHGEDAKNALASQLDPDLDVSGISGATRDSRRVSSFLSRGELSTSFDRNAFHEMATQRTSLGGSFNSQHRGGHMLATQNDRLSFDTHRSHYGSSRLSILGDRLSLGIENVDETIEDFQTTEDRNTMQDSVDLELSSDLGSLSMRETMSGLRKEVILTKFGEVPMIEAEGSHQLTYANMRPQISVFTMKSINSARTSDTTAHRCYIHILDRSTASHVAVQYVVHRLDLKSVNRASGARTATHDEYALIANVKEIVCLPKCIDAVAIEDGAETCLAILSKGAEAASKITLHTSIPIALELDKLRLFSPFSLAKVLSSVRGEAGHSRVISLPSGQRLVHTGPKGTFDLKDELGVFHSLQIQLRPRNELVAKALNLFRVILPNEAGSLITSIWWDRVRNASSNYSLIIEWEAFVAAVFAFTLFIFPENTSKARDRTTPGSRHIHLPKSSRNSTSKPGDAWKTMCYQASIIPGSKPTWNSVSWNWMVQKSSQTRRSMSGSFNDFVVRAVENARGYISSEVGRTVRQRLLDNDDSVIYEALQLLVYILHVLREEQKLDIATTGASSTVIGDLCLMLAQLGGWLNWDKWSWKRESWYYLDGKNLENCIWDELVTKPAAHTNPPFESPPGVFEWLENSMRSETHVQFPTLGMVLHKILTHGVQMERDQMVTEIVNNATPRLEAISRYLRNFHFSDSHPLKSVELMKESGIDRIMLETFPEAVSALIRETIARCQANPSTTWDAYLLRLVGREDLDMKINHDDTRTYDHSLSQQVLTVPRDVRTICDAAERVEPLSNSVLADGSMITRLIFSQDQRFIEAAKLVEPLRTQVAECPPDRSWSDTEMLEAQKTVVQYVMIRTFAIAPAQAMVHFDSRCPLPTEKFAIHGYTTMCIMKPMNITITANRDGYTEERYAWAWFHAGVSAGLSISRRAEGIDTSWIVFNKPADLTNRHAGLLLGLGLNGHLKSLAKWLSFKYLTPKHTMTSVGLLLGLSAAFLGTMDTLVTRLLSVHVTRMLPSGAAELNLSPLTQTTGLMGIGLLYCDTQHRRMSEVMISEIEHVETDDSSAGNDTLRDEGYRLAAGFSLGFINLAKGNQLKGLHDMRVIERLLAVAVGPRPVDLVHVLDQATAGATIAIALMFMKTEDRAIAKKVDIPDTLPQFDFVRPDILLLRTLAKHLIMWNDIHAEYEWVMRNLPPEYTRDFLLRDVKVLRTEHLPFFNILAGLLWSVSLKNAGTGDIRVRDFLIYYLDQFIRLCNLPALRYDAKLARNTVRNCQDLIALSAATVMAGRGDLLVFRRLRLLHGRINPDTPYGSHLAAHLAIGVLFLGGGRYTFGTSPLAVAALICAFYPLFPQDVLDNKAHLQAFRHLWVLAAEPRCLIVRDVDTHRAVPMPISILLRDGSELVASAPCLLPELHLVTVVKTTSPEYWPVVLDFQHNPQHLAVFRGAQTLHVRRRPISEIHGSVFSATLLALNDAQNALAARLFCTWIFDLPLFRKGPIVENAEWSLVLPTDAHNSVYMESRGTVVDHKLGLMLAAKSNAAHRLWNIRCVLLWSEQAISGDGRLRWLGWEVLQELQGRILERSRAKVQ